MPNILDQAGPSRISFSVVNHAAQIILRTNEVIVRLVLPESAGSAKKLIGVVRSTPFYFLHDLPQRELGENHNVDVICHDYPGCQILEAIGEVDDFVADQLSNAGVCEPNRTGCGAIGFGVQESEAFSIRQTSGEGGGNSRLRSGEAPGYEDPGIRRLPVGQFSSVELILHKMECAIRGKLLKRKSGQPKGCHTRAKWFS